MHSISFCLLSKSLSQISQEDQVTLFLYKVGYLARFRASKINERKDTAGLCLHPTSEKTNTRQQQIIKQLEKHIVFKPELAKNGE